MEHDLVEQATLLNTRKEYNAWEQRCDKYIESLEEQSRIKCPWLSIGNNWSHVSRGSRVWRNLCVDDTCMWVPGTDSVGASPKRHSESRIPTSAMINSKHIEPRRFFEDASKIVEHVHNVMQWYDPIKINIVFNGEFVASDKRANKNYSELWTI